MKAEMKAVVASLVVIALALTAVSGITYSWFSDEEKATVNVTTGTIDLKIDGDPSATVTYDGDIDMKTKASATYNAPTHSVNVNVTNAAPGAKITVTIPTVKVTSGLAVNYYEIPTISRGLTLNGNYGEVLKIDAKDEPSSTIIYGDSGKLGDKLEFTLTVSETLTQNTNGTPLTLSASIELVAVQANAPISSAIEHGGKNYSSLTNLFADNDSVTFTDDIKFDESVRIDKDITIDAGSKTIDITDLSIYNNAQVTIKNGTLKTETTSAGIYVDAGCNIELDTVTYDASGYGLYPRGDAASVTVKNSTITAGVMAIATNAKVLDNYGVVITIENSEITTTSTDFDNVAVMINVEGTLNISNSKITGDRQALIVRAGTANIVDTDFISTGKYVEKAGSNRDTDKWADGNEVSSATIVVGNLTSNAYKADASLSLDKDSSITNSSGGKSLIIAQDGVNGYKASISLSSDATPINAIKKTGFELDSESTISISPGKTVTVI